MSSKDEYVQIKLLLIGDSSVGKSSLLKLYHLGEVSQTLTPTLGCDYSVIYEKIQDKNVQLFVWDTAGQEKYRAITKQWYKQSRGILVVFAVDNRQSFLNVNRWINDLSQYVENYSLFLIGNKTDLGSERTVTYQEAQQFADQNKIPYYETTIYEDRKPNQAVTIKYIFQELARDVLKKDKEQQEQLMEQERGSFHLKELEKDQNKKGCKC